MDDKLKYRESQHSDDGPRDHVVYGNDPDLRGKIVPVKTQMAALLIILLAIGLFIRSTQFDKGYDSSKAHGMCEAKLGWVHGGTMLLTCGVKTNRFGHGHWYCKDHPPEKAQDYKGD